MSKHEWLFTKANKPSDTKLPSLGHSISFHGQTASTRAKQVIKRPRATTAAACGVSRASVSTCRDGVSELSRRFSHMTIRETKTQAGRRFLNQQRMKSEEGLKKRQPDLRVGRVCLYGSYLL